MKIHIHKRDLIQFNEVYASDMVFIKQIFKEASVLNSSVKESFGLPFLLAKKENKIVAFASLVVNDKDKIDFLIYNNQCLGPDEKLHFNSFSSNFIQKKNGDNFTDKRQLQNSIKAIVSWLDL